MSISLNGLREVFDSVDTDARINIVRNMIEMVLNHVQEYGQDEFDEDIVVHLLDELFDAVWFRFFDLQDNDAFGTEGVSIEQLLNKGQRNG